jgi:hypothetical protein
MCDSESELTAWRILIGLEEFLSNPWGYPIKSLLKGGSLYTAYLKVEIYLKSEICSATRRLTSNLNAQIIPVLVIAIPGY